MKIPLKFGLWQATHLFTQTGQDIYQILNDLHVSVQEWNTITAEYAKFPILSQKAFARLLVFGTKDAQHNLDQFLCYFEDKYHVLREPEDTLSSFTKKVQTAIFQNPHISIFKTVDWVAIYIADFPRISGTYYTHDGEYVYCGGERLKDKKGNRIDGVDPSSFYVLSRSFMRDKNHIYAEQKVASRKEFEPTFTILKKVDIASFQTIGNFYAYDNNAVYFHSNKRVSSTSSCQLSLILQLVMRYNGPVYLESDYAKDEHHVYYRGTILSLKPTSFHQLGHSEYFTDEENIYFQGKNIHADVVSFVVDTNERAHDNYAKYAQHHRYQKQNSNTSS